MTTGIMPNMYTTTYRSYFTPHTFTSDMNRDIQTNYKKKSFVSFENSSIPQQQKKAVDIPNDRLPPLNQRSTDSTVDTKNVNAEQFSMKPNVQRSGFWCENPVVDHHSKYEMKTTNQEMFGQPTLDKSNNNSNKNKKNNRFSAFPVNSMSPFVREPILIPSSNSLEQNSNDDCFTTTTQMSYPKYEVKPVAIPSNVSMATTGFQRGPDVSIGVKSGSSTSKIAKCEIEKLRLKDPVAYLEAQSDNPFVSINQLYYKVPPKVKPF